MQADKDIYLVLFWTGLASMSLPLILLLISALFSRMVVRPGPAAEVEPRNRIKESSLINFRYFLVFNSVMILLIFAVLLIPLAIQLNEFVMMGSKNMTLKSVLQVFMVLFMLCVGLVYLLKKGDLSWLRSYSYKDEKE